MQARFMAKEPSYTSIVASTDEACADDTMSTSNDEDQPPLSRCTRCAVVPFQVAVLLIVGVMAALLCSSVASAGGFGMTADQADDVNELSDKAIEHDIHFDDFALASFNMPPPRCRCKGWHGATDAYHGGAAAADGELCMGPWGGPYSPCMRVDKHGRCPRGTMKCTTDVHPSPEPAPLANMTGKVGGDNEADEEDAAPCLCTFDNDRTLTAKQNSNKNDWRGRQQCPGTVAVPGAWDNAFGHGTLTLSPVGAGGLAQTACGGCYVGIASYGNAGNWREKHALAAKVLDTRPYQELAANHSDARTWTYGIHIPSSSPLVVYAHDRMKQWAVEGILAWYWSKGVKIQRNRVWHYDDRADNAAFFAGTGFNARQISCRSRDSRQRGVGYCGATPDEITRVPGVYSCKHPPLANSTVERASGHLRGAPSLIESK
eukprot:CAMPEP_0117483020 /NCGR_PEP_ID=MMETSP0784-20121206/13722_1 /TAXON_ID=39447 /ORGANISM="" /LENGTH=430 /DNA_ID=CAMNT_0005277539 /DNA_START=32 /DNA_END=1324 /DNA_ORIENTATION=-